MAKPQKARPEWSIHGDISKRARDGVAWVKGQIHRYDCRRLERIIVRPNSYSDEAAVGSANPPPRRSRKFGWRLIVEIGARFPGDAILRMPPLYRKDGTWDVAKTHRPHVRRMWEHEILEAYSALSLSGEDRLLAPFSEEHTRAGCSLGNVVHRGDAEWIEVNRRVPLVDASEAVVLAVSAGAYYWLRRTHQEPGRHDDIWSARYGVAKLSQFRFWRRKQ